MTTSDEPKIDAKTEQAENESWLSHIQFDDSCDTLEVVGKLTEWWEASCTAHAVDPDDKRFKNVLYFILELAKNALEHGYGGEVQALFGNGAITVTVTDHGQGFENPNDDILYGAPGHGLSQVKGYADELTIETNGKKFVKVPKRKRLLDSDETDVKTGTKITFVKKF